jgi:predicted enzyme related to lactoylglutathione lyase
VTEIRLGAISLDCADPRPLAEFWAELLGGDVVLAEEQIWAVGLGHLLVTAMRVDGYTAPTWPEATVPKQCHIDLAVDDLDEAEARAVAAGAVRATVQPEPDGYRVLLDPAGHPFCLSLSSNFPG